MMHHQRWLNKPDELAVRQLCEPVPLCLDAQMTQLLKRIETRRKVYASDSGFALATGRDSPALLVG